MRTISIQVVGLVGPAGRLGGVVGRWGISSFPSSSSSSTVLRQEVSQGKGLPFLIPLLFSCYKTYKTKNGVDIIILDTETEDGNTFPTAL